jgi:multidrug transporter EmrE-like cation transporter
MAWLFLLVAGLCEIAWAIGLCGATMKLRGARQSG